jgi:hypothetical protein
MCAVIKSNLHISLPVTAKLTVVPKSNTLVFELCHCIATLKPQKEFPWAAGMKRLETFHPLPTVHSPPAPTGLIQPPQIAVTREVYDLVTILVNRMAGKVQKCAGRVGHSMWLPNIVPT